MKNWLVIEQGYVPAEHYKNETIYALSNGFIGMRDTFSEGYFGPEDKSIEGNFINGFYESETIMYGEKGYGFPDVSQTMLNVPNAKGFEITVDGQACHMFSGDITDYKRVLDLKTGLVTREYVWTKSGRSVRVIMSKLVSMVHKNKAAIRLEVLPLSGVTTIKVSSFIEGHVINDTPRTNARIDYGPYEKVLIEKERKNNQMLHESKGTKFQLITDIQHTSEPEGHLYNDGTRTGESFEGESVCLDKIITYHASTDQCLDDVESIFLSFEDLSQLQAEYYNEFWQYSDVTIEGDDDLQLGMRFNMFHLLQATGRDGKTSVGAKGLTGEGYEGHAFWDTEMYAAPFFMYTKPDVAKALLTYRYNTLDQARSRAEVMAVKGALFPWRTINGEEASPYFPAGTAQYHINADIAFAVQKYYDITGDDAFYHSMGVELLIETARFWLSFGDYIPSKGNQFCLNGVTGPDEYTAIVNNNFYTNQLAKENLINASKAYKSLSTEDRLSIDKKLTMSEDETVLWQEAADKMYIAFDETSGLYPQDDSFFDKAVWDIKNTPKEKFPLLDNYHPLMIYNKQVSKQADIILALFLLEYNYDIDMLKKHYDYYEKVTVHESSLSFCIHSILASHIGYSEQAYDYFMKSARLDLDDVHGNTHAGIHMANLAGTWMCIVNGFGGMTMDGSKMSFKPVLPESWQAYSFIVSFKGSTIKVNVSDQVTYELLKGPSVTIVSHGEEVEVKHV